MNTLRVTFCISSSTLVVDSKTETTDCQQRGILDQSRAGLFPSGEDLLRTTMDVRMSKCRTPTTAPALLLQVGCIGATITSATFRAMPLQVSKACSHRGRMPSLRFCAFEEHPTAFMRSRLFVIGSSDFSSSGTSDNAGPESSNT